MPGSVAAVTAVIAVVVPSVAADFTPVTPIGGTGYDVAVVAEAESGVRQLVCYTCTRHSTAEDARDAAALQLKGGGWDVRVVGETKLIVVGYKGSPVRRLEVETTNGTRPVARRVVAPPPWPRVVRRDAEAARRERLANVRRSIDGMETVADGLVRRVGQLAQPDPGFIAHLLRNAQRYREEVKKLRVEERKLWAQQPGGITAPAPRPVAPKK